MESNNIPISFSERLATGFISALIMAVMAVCIPVAAIILGRGRGLEALGSFSTFHIWGTSVTVVAGLMGLVLGSDRASVLFGHLWGTEEPKRIGVTLALWSALSGIAFVSYWLFGLYQALSFP